MASPFGRGLRIAAGIALITLGLWLDSNWGVAAIVIGVVPLLAGVFDVCVFSALFGGPFVGKKIRALHHRR